MNELQHGSAIQVDVRVLGFPGTFAAWGVATVRQILEGAGYPTEIVPLEHSLPAPEGPAAGSPAIRIRVGHGPVMVPADRGPPIRRPTIVFLDTPAWAVQDLLATGKEPMEAVRQLAATLAPLGAVLPGPGVLLVQRTAAMDLLAIQGAIASHLSAALPLLAQAVPAGAPTDLPAPPPPLSGQALTLTRQVLTPLLDLVTGTAHEPVVWPLACFYAGDQPNELAPPLIDVAGPARILYYGPYFYLPRGRWRADVQFFLTGNMSNTMLAVDVFAEVELIRRQFRPTDGGLIQVSLPFVVDRAEDRIELRVWLLRGAIEGCLGLRQVLLHPMQADER